MMTIINRICTFNSLRYKQEHVPELTAECLFEEAAEFNDARSGSEVEQLDALIDSCYFAIGAMWKMGLTPKQIYDAFMAVCDANATKPVVKTASDTKANIDKGSEFIPPEPVLQRILDERRRT